MVPRVPKRHIAFMKKTGGRRLDVQVGRSGGRPLLQVPPREVVCLEFLPRVGQRGALLILNQVSDLVRDDRGTENPCQ